jgi:hypothetical protein
LELSSNCSTTIWGISQLVKERISCWYDVRKYQYYIQRLTLILYRINIISSEGCPSICREFTNFVLEFMHKMSELTTNRRASLITSVLSVYLYIYYINFVNLTFLLGNPVVWFIMCSGDGHNTYGLANYDHIEPVFGIYSNHPLSDLTVYNDDVLVHGSDWDLYRYYR